ncbi:hypothetical protein BH24ACT3_BH24ACT3_05130 [soil metagenome]
MSEAVLSGNRLSLGWPEPYESRGIGRRIELMESIWPLRGERLLDLGCGNGSYTTAMADGFDQIVGVEIEPVRLAEFRAQLQGRTDAGKFKLRQQGGEHLDDPDGSFDVVTAIEVLEHVDELEATVRQVARVLRPGGASLVTVPNRGFPFETHSFMIRGRERRSKWFPFVPWVGPLHRRISTARNFRPGDLRRLILPAGFAEVGTTYLMPPLERWGPGRHLRGPVERLERTPLRTFGVSVVAAYRRLP